MHSHDACVTCTLTSAIHDAELGLRMSIKRSHVTSEISGGSPDMFVGVAFLGRCTRMSSQRLGFGLHEIAASTH